ncbi:MAG: prenyltransferase/squalene oxidase repeat-containing protein [Patescibacteria group bacterium]|nr:prenyltransferase/squalene oxidase repeat-containing protein [Patescibacteria group bacterium]
MRNGCIIVVMLLPGLAMGQSADPDRKAAELITPRTDQAVERGLRWLAGQQQEDGSLGSGVYRGNVAVASLGGMAWISGGSTPERGPHGRAIDRTIAYLLAKTQHSGFIVERAGASHGPMYGHGFSTMFLADCYGMSNRPELRAKLAAAVKLIVNSQNKEGGWRYQPQPADADISVTVCQIMALRAARNAGLYVPNETVDRCLDYVRRCQNPDGGFMYMALAGGDSLFPRSAAGVVALQSAGVYKGPEIDKGIEYLLRFTPEPGASRQDAYYFYGHYYAVQAMWHVGGEAWSRWYPAIREELVAQQNPDGSWPTTSINREYATAMALIVLQAPNNYLPIFQR